MHSILLQVALIVGATPYSKNLEIQAPLRDTVSAIIVGREKLIETFNSEILEHKIETVRPRVVIGKNPRVALLIRSRLKMKVKVPLEKKPIIVSCKETVEVGEHIIYELKAEENQLFKRFHTRIELWEEDGITRGKVELWMNLKKGSGWSGLFARIVLVRVNKAINELVNPPQPEEEKPVVEDNNQEQRTDRRDSTQLPIGLLLP